MKTKMRLPLPALYITPREKKFQKEEALLDSKSADDNTVNKDNSSDKNNTNLDLNSRKAGPPQGHEGISHHNRSEYVKRYDMYRCANCGNKHVMILRPVVRQMYDFDGDRISIVAGTIVVGRCKCDRCGHVTVAHSPLIAGTAYTWPHMWRRRHIGIW